MGDTKQTLGRRTSTNTKVSTNSKQKDVKKKRGDLGRQPPARGGLGREVAEIVKRRGEATRSETLGYLTWGRVRSL